MQIVLKIYSSSPPHLLAFPCISFSDIAWFPGERTLLEGSLPKPCLLKPKSCPFSELFSTLPCYSCTPQPPSAKGSSACCSFSMGHSSLNYHTVTPILSSRATFSEKHYLISLTPLAQALSTPFVSLFLLQ